MEKTPNEQPSSLKINGFYYTQDSVFSPYEQAILFFYNDQTFVNTLSSPSEVSKFQKVSNADKNGIPELDFNKFYISSFYYIHKDTIVLKYYAFHDANLTKKNGAYDNVIVKETGRIISDTSFQIEKRECKYCDPNSDFDIESTGGKPLALYRFYKYFPKPDSTKNWPFKKNKIFSN